MSGELLIRPSMNDHEVIRDLLAPGGSAIMLGRHRPIVNRLVVDAPVAARRAQFAEAAADAGIPFLVDPLTPLLQGVLREEDPWATLAFGTHEPLDATHYAERAVRGELVSQVVDFQLEHGATAVIPPYPYAAGPDDPWFHVGLDCLRLTRAYMNSIGVAVPLVPVLCGQLMKFVSDQVWATGLDRFAAVAADAGAHTVALCLSPAGSGKDSYHKVWRLFEAFYRMKHASQLPVIAWRQGIFGSALVAAGIDGYETGIGLSEQSNIRAIIAARRPPKPGEKAGRGAAPGIYVEPLGRSLNPRVARRLLSQMSMRPKMMCTDERCCPQGVSSTLDHAREHAIRSRARELAVLDSLPARSWRLNHIVTKTNNAVSLAKQANRVLAEATEPREPLRIHTTGLEALSRVAEELRRADSEGRVA